jgi:hypothetical protein
MNILGTQAIRKYVASFMLVVCTQVNVGTFIGHHSDMNKQGIRIYKMTTAVFGNAVPLR